MSNSRNNILQRLRQTPAAPCHFSERDYLSQYDWDKEQCIAHFSERMQAVRTEIHRASDGNWRSVLQQICQQKGLNNLLLAKETPYGQQLYADPSNLPTLHPYQHPIENWKQELFQTTDASLTTTLGGIAETGSLMLWPDEQEPRLMSLVPPVHIALLEADKLYSTFAQAIQAQGWAAQGMPSNALLISGPSKSADIAQVLAYGVHGPKALVVIIVG